MRRERLPMALLMLALGLASAAAAVVLYAPLLTTTSVSFSSDGTVTRTSTRTLLEEQGSGIFFAALAPVVVVLVPTLAYTARARRPFVVSAAAAITLLGLFVVLTGFSIGLFYVPTLGALVAAVGVVMAAPQRLPTANAP